MSDSNFWYDAFTTGVTSVSGPRTAVSVERTSSVERSTEVTSSASQDAPVGLLTTTATSSSFQDMRRQMFDQASRLQPSEAGSFGAVGDRHHESGQADREERRRYLEQHQALDFLTKVVMKTDATCALRDEAVPFLEAVELDEFDPDKTEIAVLQKEYEEETEKADKLIEQIRALKIKLRALGETDHDSSSDEGDTTN